jgi:uncharacterized protein (DUF488 family)
VAALFTIGFAKRSAEEFFDILAKNKVRKVMDIRLNNVSQLAGFTKKDDLRYFLKKIGEMDYAHHLELAPTDELLRGIRDEEISWDEYEKAFYVLMKKRKSIETFSLRDLDHACLLCSEY